jgi:hypothetical protein
MYVNQAIVCVVESFVHRANVYVILKRSSRKPPISHTSIVRWHYKKDRQCVASSIGQSELSE